MLSTKLGSSFSTAEDEIELHKEPDILGEVAAHLLLYTRNLTPDPLDEPVQLRHLVLGVFEVITMPAYCQLQLLDLVSER